MKNGLVIFSNSQFNKKISIGNTSFTINKKFITKLKKYFTIDDFSNEELSLKAALNFINVFANKRSYSCCLVALGDADLDKSILDFKEEYEKLIESLLSFNIKPIILKVKNNDYANVIDEVSLKYNLTILSNNTKEIYKSISKLKA